MATAEQIEIAANADKARIGKYVDQDSHHILSMAHADREYEINERRRARNAVHRLAGQHHAEILAALGLDVLTTDELVLERERVRDYDALAAEAFPAASGRGYRTPRPGPATGQPTNQNGNK